MPLPISDQNNYTATLTYPPWAQASHIYKSDNRAGKYTCFREALQINTVMGKNMKRIFREGRKYLKTTEESTRVCPIHHKYLLPFKGKKHSLLKKDTLRAAYSACFLNIESQGFKHHFKTGIVGFFLTQAGISVDSMSLSTLS